MLGHNDADAAEAECEQALISEVGQRDAARSRLTGFAGYE